MLGFEQQKLLLFIWKNRNMTYKDQNIYMSREKFHSALKPLLESKPSILKKKEQKTENGKVVEYSLTDDGNLFTAMLNEILKKE